MASVDTLSDLPMAWLHRLSTSLTAESAARLRSTCKLLREVIDATWEPAPVPPHRRSVPLTLEQIEAQLPLPWWLKPQPRQPGTGSDRGGSSKGGSSCETESSWETVSSYEEEEPSDDDAAYWEAHDLDWSRPKQDGCHQHWLETFGPAMTRLTANQAVNLLNGKPMVSCMVGGPGHLGDDPDKDSSVSERMQIKVLSELLFDDPRVKWPPRSHSKVNNPNARGANMGGCESETLAEPQYERESDKHLARVVGRGVHGWEVKGFESNVFAGKCSKPAALLEKWGVDPDNPGFDTRPYDVGVITNYERLLVTTDSSCREATPYEVEQFVASDSPEDGDRFDVYLSINCRNGPADIYVFLGPVEPRFTGRPKVGAAPQGPRNLPAAERLQYEQPAEKHRPALSSHYY